MLLLLPNAALIENSDGQAAYIRPERVCHDVPLEDRADGLLV